MQTKVTRENIWAAAKMRPSKSVMDMEVSRFAAGCSRDVIKDGAEMLGWELAAQ